MPRLFVQGQLEVPTGLVQLVNVAQDGPSEELFYRDGLYWVNFCLTPRRPDASARFVDRWGPHRSSAMGPLFVLPPRERLQLQNAGGRHTSIVCQLHAEAVERWLPDDFEWTDRRLEACLDLGAPVLRGHLVRLAQELRHAGVGRTELVAAICLQVSIELARFLTAVSEPTEKGGLADWRLRAIDRRLAEPGPAPTLLDLAKLCKVSVRQLTRAFRKSRGCSVGDYIARVRIEIAKRRLASDESVKAIASALGFASSSSFAYAFRRATGATPRQFRTRVLTGASRTTRG